MVKTAEKAGPSGVSEGVFSPSGSRYDPSSSSAQAEGSQR